LLHLVNLYKAQIQGNKM